MPKRNEELSDLTVRQVAEILGVRVDDVIKRIKQTKYTEELSIPEAAEILGVDCNTIRRYLKDGELRCRDVSPARSTRTTYRIPLEDVERMRNGYLFLTDHAY